MKIDYKSFTKKYIRPKKNLFPTGTMVFKGFQGSGKTLSAVHYLFSLKQEFPDCLIYSNVIIKGIEDFELIQNDKDLDEALQTSNGDKGIVIFLDEAHLFFNKKTGISLDVLTAISQQRKDRRRLIFTSQIWEELDVSLRKQVKEVVNCRCILGKIQVNTISDGESISYDKLKGTWIAKKLRTEVFKHNQQLYDSYDTYQKIIRNEDYHRDFSPPPTIISNSVPTRRRVLSRRLDNR